ncbi:hypothetical protein QF035_010766 [Streptomyces umbrinus]|uniref:Uncharacterized protein n=1 Tax=Streptomyces umbrinus TaxID=67370 RepID=A0ABU0TBI6_9ACTN|nr:hypothetical protein [Streptomyces umbrinus]MDQ1033184.1 hypothetical protein [Streptomyces umbrinus]
MVERYFDAHLYVTNWGTHRLMLRLPKQALAPRTAQPYCLDHHVDAWTTRTHLLLDLTSEHEGGDWIEGADDSLAALIGVRDELATGDLRPLYLAWLSALTAWELEDDEEEYQTTPEPPVPAGLGELTAPQRALADFLRVDADLLRVAAQASPATAKEPARPTKKELAPLVAALPDGTSREPTGWDTGCDADTKVGDRFTVHQDPEGLVAPQHSLLVTAPQYACFVAAGVATLVTLGALTGVHAARHRRGYDSQG